METLAQAPSVSRSESRARLLFAVALAATGLLWLVLRVAYFNGYYTEDSPGYVTDALSIVAGSYHARADVNGLNVGTYMPVALALRVFGKSEVALAVWPLFCSLLGLLSLAAAAAVLFGRRFGALAALLYATYPGDIFYSTVVMPDAIQAGWLAFATALIVRAGAPGTRRRKPLLAAAGLAFGACHLVRGNALLLVPIGIVAVAAVGRLWRREPAAVIVKDVLVCLAGWLAVQAIEGGVYLWATGDFLHRVHVVDRHYGTIQSIGRFGLNTDWRTIPFSIFPPLLWARVGGWGLLNLDQSYHGFVFCLALAALLLGGLALVAAREATRGRLAAGYVLAVFWFAWPLLYHQFGSQSLTHFVPIHRLSRHLVVYAPGAVFAIAAGCALVARSLARWRMSSGGSTLIRAVRITLATAAGVVLALHLAFNLEGEQAAYESFQRIKATYARIRERLPRDVRTIVADPGDLGFFDFWLNPIGSPRVRLRVFAEYANCGQLPGGVVLTQSNPGWVGLSAPVIQETVARLPCLLRPPAAWRLLYDGYPEKIFLVPAPADAIR